MGIRPPFHTGSSQRFDWVEIVSLNRVIQITALTHHHPIYLIVVINLSSPHISAIVR
jgi:hypothetical protein